MVEGLILVHFIHVQVLIGMKILLLEYTKIHINAY